MFKKCFTCGGKPKTLSANTIEAEEDEENPPPLTGTASKRFGPGGHISTQTSRLKVHHSTSKLPLDTTISGACGNLQEVASRIASNILSPECIMHGVCDSNRITIGKPERDQIKGVGQNLFQIGRQFVQEMGLIEALLGQFAAMMGSDSDQDTCGMSHSRRSHNHSSSQEAVKAQLVEAISVQARRLSWIDQATRKYKSKDKFGSGFTSPSQSRDLMRREECNANNNLKAQDFSTQELKRRVIVMEAKMEKMACSLEVSEKQICDLYASLQGVAAKLTEETAALREEVMRDVCRSQQSRESTEIRIKAFELQIVKLAQVIWELKCETRAQMHFGKEY